MTSTHAGTGTVWGNGAVNSGVGATVDLECANCHNPHGNGQYRILQTAPSLTATAGTYKVTNSGGVQVQDTAYTGLRNYTIRPSTDGLASGVVGNTMATTGATSGIRPGSRWPGPPAPRSRPLTR